MIDSVSHQGRQRRARACIIAYAFVALKSFSRPCSGFFVPAELGPAVARHWRSVAFPPKRPRSSLCGDVTIDAGSSFVTLRSHPYHPRSNRIRSTSSTLGSSSKTAAPESEEDTTTARRIRGLIEPDAFARLSRADSAIRTLRAQLPATLTSALTPSSASMAYGPNCTVIGPSGEVLADGLDEIVALSTAVVSACNAARGAGRLAETLRASLQLQQQQQKKSTIGKDGGGDVSGSLTCVSVLEVSDPPSLLRVRWSASLPGGSVGDFRPPRIEGLSDFVLGDDGLVECHRLRNVTVDGREVNGRVGEALAAMRRAVKTAQSAARSTARDSPLLQVFAEAAVPLMTEIGEGILRNGKRVQGLDDDNGGDDDDDDDDDDDAGRRGTARSEGADLVAMFVADPLPPSTDLESWNEANFTSADIFSTLRMLDEPPRVPLPGTDGWTLYASSYGAIMRFVDSYIPLLSGEDDDFDALRSAFDPDARLIATDNSTAIGGGGRLADLYRSLCSLRLGSGGVFRIPDAPVADWRKRQVTVGWSSAFPVRVEGKDRFTLSDGGQIVKVEQLGLSVGDRNVAESDAVVAFLRAAETNAGGEVVAQILRRIASGGRSPRSTLVASGDVGRREGSSLSAAGEAGPQHLSEEAAASVYRLMRALHLELPHLVDVGPSAADAITLTLPFVDFLSQDVELRGLLGELLVRGINPYRRAVGASVSSLRAAVRAGARAAGKPVPKVELTSTGRIKLSLSLELRVDAPTLLGAGTLPIPSGIGAEGKFPIKLELVSELRLNSKGHVVEHRILENRINGRKSPADVVSGWISGAATSQGDEAQGAMKIFQDAINWARTVSG